MTGRINVPLSNVLYEYARVILVSFCITYWLPWQGVRPPRCAAEKTLYALGVFRSLCVKAVVMFLMLMSDTLFSTTQSGRIIVLGLASDHFPHSSELR